MGNIAYIDSQNLHLATKNAPDPWRVDMKRLRIYLQQKWNVDAAYLFMGAFKLQLQEMYRAFQEFGYVLDFREHSEEMTGKKKGNVDTDIVFSAMKDVYERDDFDKVILISGDGDYWRLVNHLIKKERLEKMLFPARHNTSSLYKGIFSTYGVFLDDVGVRRKIEKREDGSA